MKPALWISALFGALGLIVGPVLVVLVLNGTLEATGARPGGVLLHLGWFGGSVALLLHAYYGVFVGLAQWLAPFVALFLVVFGLIGAVRRTCAWYLFLLGPLVWWIGTVIPAAAKAVTDFGGSQWMNWDGALAFGGLVGTSLVSIGLIPLAGVLIWRWCAGSVGTSELEQRYRTNLLGVSQILGNGLSAIFAIMGLLLIALAIEAWAWSWAHRGPIFTIAAAAIASFVFTYILQLLAALVALALTALSAISLGLPIASIITVLGIGKTSQAKEPPRMDEFLDSLGVGSARVPPGDEVYISGDWVYVPRAPLEPQGQPAGQP
jgi:hypothetical protein